MEQYDLGSSIRCKGDMASRRWRQTFVADRLLVHKHRAFFASRNCNWSIFAGSHHRVFLAAPTDWLNLAVAHDYSVKRLNIAVAMIFLLCKMGQEIQFCYWSATQQRQSERRSVCCCKIWPESYLSHVQHWDNRNPRFKRWLAHCFFIKAPETFNRTTPRPIIKTSKSSCYCLNISNHLH